MDVTCLMHIRDVKQSLRGAPIYRIALVDGLQENQGHISITSIPARALRHPARQSLPIHTEPIAVAEFRLLMPRV